LTGWESAEALIQASGGALYDLFCPEDRPCILAALESLLASAGRIKAEYRLLRRSLPPLWVTLCAGLVDTEALGIHLECFLLDLSDLRRAGAELSERCQTLAEQARRETMTGLLNKDAFRLDVRTYLSAAGPEETYALLVTDLDDFKRFNDRYGHTFGDQVLLAADAVQQKNVCIQRDFANFGSDRYGAGQRFSLRGVCTDDCLAGGQCRDKAAGIHRSDDRGGTAPPVNGTPGTGDRL